MPPTLVTPTASQYHRARPVRNAEQATWMTSSDAVALSTGTVAATTISLATLFHAATSKSRIDVVSAIVSWAGGSGAGNGVKLKLGRISAVGAGGTVVNPLALDSRDNDPDPSNGSLASSTGDFVEARYGAAAPTRVGAALATVMISHANPGWIDMADVLRSLTGKFPCINQGTAEGIELFIVTGAAGPTAAADMAVSFRFHPRRV